MIFNTLHVERSGKLWVRSLGFSGLGHLFFDVPSKHVNHSGDLRGW